MLVIIMPCVVDTRDHNDVLVDHNKDNEVHLLLCTEKLIEMQRDGDFLHNHIKSDKFEETIISTEIFCK